MRYIRQFLIILVVSFLGEVLYALLPLPVPASIYGLVDAVRGTGKFLVEIMPLMFSPAAVGLTAVWGGIRQILVPLLIPSVDSTVLVMAVSGRVTQAVIRRGRRSSVNSDNDAAR